MRIQRSTSRWIIVGSVKATLMHISFSAYHSSGFLPLPHTPRRLVQWIREINLTAQCSLVVSKVHLIFDADRYSIQHTQRLSILVALSRSFRSSPNTLHF